MESSKLKNLVLIILLITNVLLAGLLIFQRVETRRYSTRALTDAVALLERNGVTVQPDALPNGSIPAPLTLERDLDWELQRFTALLGTGTTHTQRGLVSFYEGPLGRAEVHSDGSFTVTLAEGAYTVSPDDGPACRGLLEPLGYTWQTLSAPDGSPAGLRQLCPDSGGRSFPVFSCEASLTFDEDGALRGISGSRLVGQPVPDAQSESLGLPTLLVRFRTGVLELGDGCTAISQVVPGYLLTSGAGGSGRLIPVVYVVTDVNRYYVSALTGDVTRA